MNNDKKYLNDIFILQFPNGKIKLLKDNEIINNASTNNGSSGSPIIRRVNIII